MARPKLSNDKSRMLISFTEYDEDVYDYLKSLRNASALIKSLVRAHMYGGNNCVAAPPAIPSTITKKTQESKKVPQTEEKLQENTTKFSSETRKRGVPIISKSNGVGNVDALINAGFEL